jgi:hypothetical protein
MAEILKSKLAAEEAGARVHKAVHKVAKLIENSATEEEAFALWDAFAYGVDQFGDGDRLCTEEVWDYVDWHIVKWANEENIKAIRQKILAAEKTTA